MNAPDPTPGQAAESPCALCGHAALRHAGRREWCAQAYCACDTFCPAPAPDTETLRAALADYDRLPSDAAGHRLASVVRAALDGDDQ